MFDTSAEHHLGVLGLGPRPPILSAAPIHRALLRARILSSGLVPASADLAQGLAARHHVYRVHTPHRTVPHGPFHLLRHARQVSKMIFFSNFFFHAFSFCSSVIPAHVVSVVEIVIFVLSVLLHGRQVEWTVRLDFLWQVQANEEKREMDALQHSNKRILFNLLPAHVATHFLDNQFRNNMVRIYGCGLVLASLTI